MKFKFNIKRELAIAAIVSVVGFLIAFTERKQGDVAIQSIEVKLENIEENHFLDEHDIENLMQLDKATLQGTRVDKMNLKEIEKRIKQNRFVKDADIYSDLKGNMVVKVELRRPIARMVRNDGPDGYIAEDGTIMPVSDKYTTRVTLVSGRFVYGLMQLENIQQTEDGKKILEVINVIRNDDFWLAQITELDIDAHGRITMYPQVGDERIEFGVPENIETKFKKLMIFYKEILPTRGWNMYNRVNLEYEGQIIAE
jgi:cell division protein FtsQ